MQTITVKSEITENSTLADFLQQYLKSSKIPAEILADLRLVLEEIFANITCYAYPPDEPGTVILELSHTDSSICMTFIDTGRAFNPVTDFEGLDESDDHCQGGMGIHFIKSLTDHQEYNRIGQRNVFTVTKHYTS